MASPDALHWAPALPKTRSGKIMRRILRKIAANELDSLGDTSTLAEPAVVDQLIATVYPDRQKLRFNKKAPIGAFLLSLFKILLEIQQYFVRLQTYQEQLKKQFVHLRL